MFEKENLNINKAIVLAPMEDVTDVSFRIICKELGADIVYTEFVNSEGLTRNSEKTHKKLLIVPEERPVGIQIYGSDITAMQKAAEIAETHSPDLIDINAGCWVKKVVGLGAGAGLLKDPEYLQKLVEVIVKSTSVPVTVKTRLGWDENSIYILDVAKRVEDAGAKAITVHCRTRKMGHKGQADWSWIPKIKNVVNIPVILNGNIFTPQDVVDAFDKTGADGVMIARGAIGNPWIFREAKELINTGKITSVVDEETKIKTCLKHLSIAIKIKGERRAVIEHRKFYSGYLKGLYNVSGLRHSLMQVDTYAQVEDLLHNYLEYLKNITPIV